MPTEPFDLLTRNAEPEVKRILDDLANNLEEVVNFGTHIFQWYNKACAGAGDKSAPVHLLFRHFLGMMDAITILVRHGMEEPARINIRSVFETLLSIEWILESDSDRRSMAFLVWHIKEQLKLYKKTDRSTPEGQEFAKNLKGTEYDRIDIGKKHNLQAARTNLEQQLQLPKYLEAEKEYETVRASTKKMYWYRLFNGPSNIRELAKSLQKTAWYDILYRKWSGTAHATDIITGKMKNRDGRLSFTPLRYPLGIENIYILSVSFALEIYKLLIEKYDHSKLTEFNDWYRKEVSPVYHKVSKKPIFTEE